MTLGSLTCRPDNTNRPIFFQSTQQVPSSRTDLPCVEYYLFDIPLNDILRDELGSRGEEVIPRQVGMCRAGLNVSVRLSGDLDQSAWVYIPLDPRRFQSPLRRS